LTRTTSLLVLGLLAATGLTAAEPVPVIWRLDQTAQIGGLATTVLGTPRVVLDPTGSAVQFNGATDGLFVPVNPIAGCAEFTIEALINPDPTGPAEQRFLHIQDESGSRALLEIRMTDAGWALDTFLSSETTKSSHPLLDMTLRHPANQWTWVSLVYSNGHMAHYINSVKELEGPVNFTPMGLGQISLGVRQNKVYWFKGQVREVRFHPVALAPDRLQRVTSR
jgi:hypothetical protein